MTISRYLILYLALLPCFLSDPVAKQEISVPAHEVLELHYQEQKYYAVSISNVGTHDLLITIGPNNYNSNDRVPKIFISKTDTQPTSAVASNYYSTSSSGSIIFIPNQELVGVPTLYIMLYCSLNVCSADFDVELTKQLNMTADNKVKTFKDEIAGLTSAIVRVNVPDRADADRVIIHVDAISTDKNIPADINLVVGRGPDVPLKNHADSIPRSGWYEGRTAIIYKETTDLFCTNCEYVLNIKFRPNTEIRVESVVLPVQAMLHHHSYLDAVREKDYNIYTRQISEAAKNKDYLLFLNAQEGVVTVYIDCGVEPDKYETYRLKYTSGEANEEIVLTPEEHAKCKDMKYTIVVFGNENSVYSIKGAARESTNLELKRDASVIGTILPGESIDYEIFVPLYLSEKVNIKLKGVQSLELSAINCRFYSECPNSLSGQFTHVDLGDNFVQPTRFEYSSEPLPDGKGIPIDVIGNGCYPLLFEKRGMLAEDEKDLPVCAFKVTVRSHEANAVDYSLTASVEGHQPLLTAETEKGVVYAGENVHYLLYVQQVDLLSLQFQLSVLSGAAKMFVSRKNPYPMATEEAAIDHEGAIIFKNLPQFNGTYYVTISGITTSSYLLTGTIITSNSQPIDYATMLEEGRPQKGVLLMKQEAIPEQFYKFQVNLQEDWRGKIKITVNPLRGRLIMVVSKDTNVPQPSSSKWRSDTHELEISSDDPDFIRQNIYHLGLFKNFQDESSDALREITFEISYTIITTKTDQTGGNTSSNKTPLLLTAALPHSGIITAGRTIYFKILVQPKDTPVTLFKEASSGDIDIYLSTDPNNQYPGPQNYKLTTVNTHRKELTIQKTDLDQACLGTGNENAICTVYFSVSTTSSEAVPYSLSLHIQSSHYSDETKAVALQDGKERQFKLPAPGNPALFYFYPVPKENVVIDVFSAGKDIRIYVSMTDLLVGENAKTEHHFPSNFEADITSIANEDDLHSGTANLAIPGDPLAPPKEVTIAVYFENSARPGSASNTTTFSIIASSQTRYIHPSKPYRGSVNEDSYLYFVLDVPKPNCTLLITLTNVGDGDADLFVSMGTFERPTKEDHKFASSTRQRTEVLEINLLDIFPNPEMKGTWVIGVYGKSKGAFILTASYEAEKTIQLYEGLPNEMYMKKNSKIYFKYFHDRNTTFDLRVDKQSGELGVYVSALDANQNAASVRPVKGNSTWELTEESVLTIGPEDSKFCSDCLYIIGIEVIKASKFSLLVTEVGGITLLQSSLRYFDKLKPQEKKKYMLVLKNSEELTLSASLTAGQVNIYALNNLIVNKTHYVWKMQLDPENTYEVMTMKKEEFRKKQHIKSFWNGEQHVISQENVFYFDFENPGNVGAEYSFSLQPPETTILLSVNDKNDFIFKDKEERSFLYYSPHLTGSLNLQIKYCITYNNEKEDLDDRITELTEGFDSQINFWTEKATVGVGEEIPAIKDEVIVENIRDAIEEGHNAVSSTNKSICIKQLLEVEGQEEEGRYEFIFINPYDQEIDVSIRLDATELKLKSLDSSYHGVEHFEVGEERSYEVVFPGEGYSYLNFFACSGVVTVQVGDSLEAIKSGNLREFTLSQFGDRRELFDKSSLGRSNTKYFIIKTHAISEQFKDFTADVLISTNAFTQDTGEYKSSDKNDEKGALHDPELKQKWEFDYDDSSLTVTFKPIIIPDASPQHNLLYYVRLCPKGVIQNVENHCVPFNNPDECYMSHQSTTADSNKYIVQTIESIPPGDYDIHVSANLNYGEKFVRSFAYRANTLSLGEPIMNKIWDLILFFLTIGLVSICLCFGFQWMKKSQREQGREMRVFRKTRDYGFVGDEDEDEDKEDDNLRRREST